MMKKMMMTKTKMMKINKPKITFLERMELSKIIEVDEYYNKEVVNDIKEDKLISNKIFSSCVFEGISFAKIKLDSVCFIDCRFANCDLSNLDLSQVDLTR